ncbi:hypothetical protein GGX14DRAFT_573418 [Mycena pura]|uniref:Uncharacterized protein n=1 Tax=Mycena pura TaxID=153505 RepID=A0AAD6Y618_9AGAR|nr:hypothetical protein GGX14DRAFT_573418 [Mycena pura]
MTLLSILTICLLLCRPALSAADLAARDDLNPALTDRDRSRRHLRIRHLLPRVRPAPEQRANAALQVYESDIVMRTGVVISDPSFLAWAGTGFPDWSQASAACDNAENNYEVALASATPAPSSAAPASPSASPGASSASPGASATPAPSSAPPTPSGPPPSSAVQPPASPSPSPSQPGSAALHAPSWALALAGLVVAFRRRADSYIGVLPYINKT